MTTFLLFSNSRQAYYEACTVFGVRYTTRPERAKRFITAGIANLFSPDPIEFVPVEFDNSARKEEKYGFTF